MARLPPSSRGGRKYPAVIPERAKVSRLSFRGASKAREPGIYWAARMVDEWIPGPPVGRPGMTMEGAARSGGRGLANPCGALAHDLGRARQHGIIIVASEMADQVLDAVVDANFKIRSRDLLRERSSSCGVMFMPDPFFARSRKMVRPGSPRIVHGVAAARLRWINAPLFGRPPPRHLA